MSTDKKANIIKADKKLQEKVGTGRLDQTVVENMQEVMEKNEVDFAPLGLEILDRLHAALERASDPSITMQQVREMLIKPVMELKANASTFKYDLIGSLANIMLRFLEAIKVMDRDAIEIVKAHHKSLHMIVVRKMSGDGGVGGTHLMRELQQACDRYYQRKNKS